MCVLGMMIGRRHGRAHGTLTTLTFYGKDLPDYTLQLLQTGQPAEHRQDRLSLGRGCAQVETGWDLGEGFLWGSPSRTLWLGIVGLGIFLRRIRLPPDNLTGKGQSQGVRYSGITSFLCLGL